METRQREKERRRQQQSFHCGEADGGLIADLGDPRRLDPKSAAGDA